MSYELLIFLKRSGGSAGSQNACPLLQRHLGYREPTGTPHAVSDGGCEVQYCLPPAKNVTLAKSSSYRNFGFPKCGKLNVEANPVHLYTAVTARSDCSAGL